MPTTSSFRVLSFLADGITGAAAISSHKCQQ
jgi:hypothetical protein